MMGKAGTGGAWDQHCARARADGAALAAEVDGSGSVLRRYVFAPGDDEPLVWYEGSGASDRRFLHADERGSIIAVSDGGGTVTNVNSYDAHGIPAPGNVGRFQYTGQAWLAELGLYDYKARLYSPTLGRFLQTDPIGYGDGLNWYDYAGGDPINNRDPDGLDSRDLLRQANDQPPILVYGPMRFCSPGFWTPVCGPFRFGPAFDPDQRDLDSEYFRNALKQLVNQNLRQLGDKTKEIAAQVCEATIDGDGNPVDGVSQRASNMAAAIISSGVGALVGAATERWTVGLGTRIGREIGFASRIVGRPARMALTGGRLGSRLGVVGALVGAGLSAYYAKEIEQFKEYLKAKLYRRQ